MRVLMVRPMEHPEEMYIQNALESIYRELECEYITVVHPWGSKVALVTDEEGMSKRKTPCRYIQAMPQPIYGNFFLCGEYEGTCGREFTDLSTELMDIFKEMFWWPELIMFGDDGLNVTTIIDGGAE